jgi:threonine/homoserine/homoserine lactone efflux protein
VTALVALLAGLALGFSLTIPPGPMNALIAARSVRSLRAGVATGLGAMSADAVLGLAVYALHTVVSIGPWVRIIEAGGAALLLVVAYRVFRTSADPATGSPSDARAYSEALVVGISNPFQILWWLTAGLAFAYVGGAVLFVGLFGAIAVWIVAFPSALRYGVRRHAGLPRLITYVSVGLLVAFAAYFAVLASGIPI